MLCDQPLVSAKNLLALRDSFARTKSLIVASAYENSVGVPALFARDVFSELAKLRGRRRREKKL
jgi:molybdenum cofactor cytidylyltransferase